VRYPFLVRWLRSIAKKVLPDSFVEWYRRRRAMRAYLKELSHEVYDRGIRVELDEVEERVAARREGFYGRLVKDVLERTELILQQLDRRIEGVSARHGTELEELRNEVSALRAAIADLQQAVGERPRASEPVRVPPAE
jgi:hypothetical protein